MTKQERTRLKRLERRCDWLEARIAISASKGREAAFDIAELSALRWAVEWIKTACGDSEQSKREQNGRLQHQIARQRKLIRSLVAYQQRIPLTDDELDALIDAANWKDTSDRSGGTAAPDTDTIS